MGMFKTAKLVLLIILIIIAYLYAKDHGWIGEEKEKECQVDEDCWPEGYEPSMREVHQCVLNKCYYLNLTKTPGI